MDAFQAWLSFLKFKVELLDWILKLVSLAKLTDFFVVDWLVFVWSLIRVVCDMFVGLYR